MKRVRNDILDVQTEYQKAFQWKSTLKSLLVLHPHMGIWMGILSILP